MRVLMLIATHLGALAAGVALGIYLLPIIAAPPAPSAEAVALTAERASYIGEFRRELADSDALHWGEGKVYVGPDQVTLEGAIAPGPAYILYLSPEFVETEEDFLRLKSSMRAVGGIQTFDNFIVPLPRDVNLDHYTSVIVWCEAFSQFITAARYRT